MAKNALKRLQRIEMPMLYRRRNGKRCPRFYPDLQQGKPPVRKSIRLFGRPALLLQHLHSTQQTKSGLDVLDDGDLNGFITKMSSAFGKDYQALDATLTALAGLATGANKLPYFTGTDKAAQTDLTKVGRDIIGKNTIDDILAYLGLGDGSGRLIQCQVFKSSGTYTPTKGTKFIIVEIVGGGGAGGGCQVGYPNNAACGGGDVRGVC